MIKILIYCFAKFELSIKSVSATFHANDMKPHKISIFIKTQLQRTISHSFRIFCSFAESGQEKMGKLKANSGLNVCLVCGILQFVSGGYHTVGKELLYNG